MNTRYTLRFHPLVTDAWTGKKTPSHNWEGIDCKTIGEARELLAASSKQEEGHIIDNVTGKTVS